MNRLPYFQLAEEVIVDSRRCPDMNGLQVIVKRIQMAGVAGGRTGQTMSAEWMYQMLSDNPDKARWLMESSLKKVCEPCGQTFSQVIEGVHRGIGLDDGTYKGIALITDYPPLPKGITRTTLKPPSEALRKTLDPEQFAKLQRLYEQRMRRGGDHGQA